MCQIEPLSFYNKICSGNCVDFLGFNNSIWDDFKVKCEMYLRNSRIEVGCTFLAVSFPIMISMQILSGASNFMY